MEYEEDYFRRNDKWEQEVRDYEPKVPRYLFGGVPIIESEDLKTGSIVYYDPTKKEKREMEYHEINTGCNGENTKQPNNKDLRSIVTMTVKLNALGNVALGPTQPNPVIECTNDFLRIGCTGITYEAFEKISKWWEEQRRGRVSRMQG